MDAKQIQQITTAVTTAIIAALGTETPAKRVTKPSAKSTAKPVARKPVANKVERHARLSKEQFTALKAKGVVPWGMTQIQAREAGLIPTLPVTRKAPVKTSKKAPTKVTKPATNKKGSRHSWDRSLTTKAKLSGLYVGDVSLYRHVLDRWDDVKALRADFTPVEVFDLFVEEAQDAGTLTHKSDRA